MNSSKCVLANSHGRSVAVWKTRLGFLIHSVIHPNITVKRVINNFLYPLFLKIPKSLPLLVQPYQIKCVYSVNSFHCALSQLITRNSCKLTIYLGCQVFYLPQCLSWKGGNGLSVRHLQHALGCDKDFCVYCSQPPELPQKTPRQIWESK